MYDTPDSSSTVTRARKLRFDASTGLGPIGFYSTLVWCAVRCLSLAIDAAAVPFEMHAKAQQNCHAGHLSTLTQVL